MAVPKHAGAHLNFPEGCSTNRSSISSFGPKPVLQRPATAGQLRTLEHASQLTTKAACRSRSAEAVSPPL